MWDKVWKREKLEHIRFRLDFTMAEDCVFIWDSFTEIQKAVLLPNKLYHYRWFQTSLTKGSGLDKYIKALPAWYYLKNKATEIGSTSLPAICGNIIKANLNAANVIALSRNRSYDWNFLRRNILEEKKYFKHLSKYNKISAHLLIRSWIAFIGWAHVERWLKSIYVKIHR